MGHVHPGFAALTITDITQPIVAGEPGVRIVPPQDCSRIVIENGDTVNSIKVQTDPSDAATQKTIPAGLELDINAKSSGDPIYPAGKTVGYLVKGSGTGPVTLTFAR